MSPPTHGSRPPITGDTRIRPILEMASYVGTDDRLPPELQAARPIVAVVDELSILALAAELQISPAIVAGRVRHKRRNFSLFSGLIGLRQVRRLFPDVKW